MANPTMARVFKREGYLRLANALKGTRPPILLVKNPGNEGMVSQWKADVEAITDMLADQSAGFDKLQFLNNCGYNSP